MKIVGYTDRLSVAPDETIRFMVSSELPEYQADIVRLIHGDTNPDGPGFKEEVINSTVSGVYPGRIQGFRSGSHVLVPDSPLINEIESFTLAAWIYPTTPQKKGLQGLLTKWDGQDGHGYGLYLGEDGSLGLWLGSSEKRVARVLTEKPLGAGQWYFVAGTFDAMAHTVLLCQLPMTDWPVDESRVILERDVQDASIGNNHVPLLMAGLWECSDSGKSIVGGHFNGKIDSPKLFGTAITYAEIKSLSNDQPLTNEKSLIAAWDFSCDFSSDKVADVTKNSLHGKTVNLPARAVTGHNWRKSEIDFKQAPKEYGAIYFHDDDLEDASWELDFEFTVPENTKSAVYAARLRADNHEDYIPFFVRPKRGTHSARIAFLAPTATYIAYANIHSLANPTQPSRARTAKKINYPVQNQDKYSIKNQLLSLYDRHNDGSGVCYSSRLRPNVTMRPKYTKQALDLGKGAPHLLDADLHLLDWMEAKGHAYDVITDEDLHLEGAELLAPYSVVVTGTHPEYWSTPMLNGLETYLTSGGRAMYLGGNGFYWIIAFDPDRPHYIEVRRWYGTQAWEASPGEYYHNTTGELGGLWRHRGRAAQALVGVGTAAEGSDSSMPYLRKADSHNERVEFIFQGIGEDEKIGDFGLIMRGAGGFEVDRADVGLGTPPHALVLATASGFSDEYNHVVEEILNTNAWECGTKSPDVRADMVYFEGPKGGAVFSVGSIAWCGSLSHNNYNNNVSRITENVLRRFTSP